MIEKKLNSRNGRIYLLIVIMGSFVKYHSHYQQRKVDKTDERAGSYNSKIRNLVYDLLNADAYICTSHGTTPLIFVIRIVSYSNISNLILKAEIVI